MAVLNFSQKLALEKEYKEWVTEKSKEVGHLLDDTSMLLMLVFLNEKNLLAPTIRCKDCANQEKIFHEDRRYKEGGYYIYGCKLNSDPFVSHCVDGLDDEFCSSAIEKGD